MNNSRNLINLYSCLNDYNNVFRDDINTRSAMRYFSGMIFVIFMEHVHGMRDENVSIEEDVKIAIDIFLNGVRNRN